MVFVRTAVVVDEVETVVKSAVEADVEPRFVSETSAVPGIVVDRVPFESRALTKIPWSA